MCDWDVGSIIEGFMTVFLVLLTVIPILFVVASFCKLMWNDFKDM